MLSHANSFSLSFPYIFQTFVYYSPKASIMISNLYSKNLLSIIDKNLT